MRCMWLALLAVNAVFAIERSLQPPDGDEQHSLLRENYKLKLREKRLKRRIRELEQKLATATPPPVNASQPVVSGPAHGRPASTVLDRDRMEAVGGAARRLILTFVNSVRLDFAATWAAHLRRLGLTNWLVGATDAGARETQLS